MMRSSEAGRVPAISGTTGSAIKKALEEKGHEVVSVGRKSGDHQADISEPESLKALFRRIGFFDAVANAAGDVFPGPLEQTRDEQWANSIRSKAMGQINLVRAALPFIADKGSFTLVSGVLADEYTYGGTIGTTINHLVEGFVKGAAAELPGRSAKLICAQFPPQSLVAFLSSTRRTADQPSAPSTR
jgi:NAD(P)-dependent dehydrogenase (short-subunit alcohol dehydrogenase family)